MEAYYAKISSDNIVENIIVIPIEQDYRGQEYITEDLGLTGKWLKTDRFSREGVKYEEDDITPTEEPAFRFTYPGVGHVYHEDLDIFTPPKPTSNPSFIWDTEINNWVPPIPRPESELVLIWDEEIQDWIEYDIPKLEPPVNE